MGIVTTKLEPESTTLVTFIIPPSILTSSLTIARPIPLPSQVLPFEPETRWNLSNNLGISFSGIPTKFLVNYPRKHPNIPTPVSFTVNSMVFLDICLRITVIPPERVNLYAFDSKFMKIFSHISRSTSTNWSSGSHWTR